MVDLSLVILNYNNSLFIDRAIRSCLLQVIFRKNIEVIVVDDNSTDKSLKVLNEFSKEIKVILNKSNKGVGYSSNKAMKASKGKYWMRVDADDFLNLNACNFMLSILEQNDNYDYVYSDHYRVDIDGLKIDKIKIDSKLKLYRHGAGILFRTDIIKKIGGYNEELRNCEDFDLLCRMDKENIKGYYLPIALYRYYIHGRNITLSDERKRMEAIMRKKYGI